jgi:hypothetical protein
MILAREVAAAVWLLSYPCVLGSVLQQLGAATGEGNRASTDQRAYANQSNQRELEGGLGIFGHVS